ncbi:MAG: hypothetical protein AAGA86_05840 [Bacteroidota bacterium]
MKTILVFKTSVGSKRKIRWLAPKLNRLVTKNGHWNFDLEDCDNILRVEAQDLDAHSIEMLFDRLGFLCEELH